MSNNKILIQIDQLNTDRTQLIIKLFIETFLELAFLCPTPLQPWRQVSIKISIVAQQFV